MEQPTEPYSDRTTEYIEAITRTMGEDPVTNILGTTVMGAAGISDEQAGQEPAAANTPREPLPAEVLQKFVATTLSEMQDLTKDDTYDPRDLDGLVQTAAAKGPEMHETLQRALRDQAQAAAALEALKLLKSTPATNQHIKSAAERLLDDLLYSSGGGALCAIAAQPDSPLSEDAKQLIVDTYPGSAYELPDVTAFVVENHFTLIDRYVLNMGRSAEDFIRMQNTRSTMGRAIAEAPRDGMISIIDTLKGIASTRKYRQPGLYHSAIIAMEGGIIPMGKRAAHTRPFLQKFGLDADRVLAAWDASKWVYDNMQTMLALEVEQPGICRTLNEELGICNFGRYTQVMLKEAYAALSNPPESYILDATANDDYNGAFRYGRCDGVRAQIQAEDPDARVIPVELASLDDIWRVVRSLRNRDWGPAEHAMLQAHGDPQASGIGKDILTTEGTDDAKGSWHALGILLRNMVKEGGTFTLSGCANGQGDDSLAQHVADVSGRETFASPEVASVRTIGTKRDPATGKLVPEIHFIHPETEAPIATRKFLPRLHQ